MLPAHRPFDDAEKAALAALPFHSAVIAGLLNSFGLILKIFGPLAKLFPYLIPYGDPVQFPASVSHGSKFSRIHRVLASYPDPPMCVGAERVC